MAATVEIDEQNGKPDSPTLAITHNLANTNMGSHGAANLDPATYPIVPGSNSCDKWQLVHVTNMGSSTRISNFKVWRSGSLGANAVHMTNARASDYGGAQTYSTPATTTSTLANQVMPTGSPASANLGIGGSLSGVLTASGYSDFLVHQIQTTPQAIAGSTTTMNYQYDETA
ncbi:MAG: hypothetical protein G01um101416_616 [Microgenomates group bacterium Gr01-1014_16]|nr:MAG: hypothetical protein G01um101416_616 [Microgenomates group bacterium Gr01-1014_16]